MELGEDRRVGRQSISSHKVGVRSIPVHVDSTATSHEEFAVPCPRIPPKRGWKAIVEKTLSEDRLWFTKFARKYLEINLCLATEQINAFTKEVDYPPKRKLHLGGLLGFDPKFPNIALDECCISCKLFRQF